VCDLLSVVGWSAVSKEGIFFTRSCALSSVGDSGRALGSGNLARVSLSGVFGFRRLTSVMVEGLPAPYVGSWVATGAATVLLVLVLIFSSLLIISINNGDGFGGTIGVDGGTSTSWQW